jgi:hypothetical protein
MHTKTNKRTHKLTHKAYSPPPFLPAQSNCHHQLVHVQPHIPQCPHWNHDIHRHTRHAPRGNERTQIPPTTPRQLPFRLPLHLSWTLPYGFIRESIFVRHGSVGDPHGHRDSWVDFWHSVCRCEASRGLSDFVSSECGF